MPEWLLPAYSVPTLMLWIWAVFLWRAYYTDRYAARLALAAPLWPVLAPLVLAWGVWKLWRAAEWGEWFRG